ncbi:MAG: MarR family transcriptional regulator [Dehalococcoidia bacterium]
MTEERQKEDLVEHVLELGARIFRELLPTIPKEVLQFDLTMPQLKVVLLLFLNGPMRMSDLAAGLSVSLATATGVVDRLVERDIVLRESEPKDRRVVLCRLSEKGQDLTDVLWQSARNRTRELLMAITIPRLKLLNEALEALLQAGTPTKDDIQQ